MEASRTFIGSVVCVDLVGYSKRTVAQQGEIKQVFNKLLMQALKKVPLEDRIILDTGDGAAISFLGDLEESLAIGIKLRDTLNGAATKLGAAEGGPVRIGINLGPVRLAVDMNGHPKIIGDGINVAEKICGFAQPGQIIVSRPFHDMVSRISDKHREIFHYEGVRTDKNVREHEIYSVTPAASDVAAPPKAKTLPPVPPPAPVAVAAAEPHGESALVAMLRDPKKWGTAAVFLSLVIVAELAAIVNRAGVSPPAPAAEIAKAPEIPKPIEPPKAIEPKPLPPPQAKPEPKAEVKKVGPKPEPPKPVPVIEKKVEPKSEPPKPAPVIEKKVEPERKPPPAPAEKKVEPEKKASPPIEKRVEPAKKVEEPPRVIPAPRTPPAQIAPTTTPAPALQPTESVPAIREEPKAAPPPTPAPPPVVTIATPITRAPVAFPLAAVNRGIESGTVRARLTINAAGAVTEVTILAADPPQVFNRAATSSLENWKFNPGADKRTYEIEIEFKR